MSRGFLSWRFQERVGAALLRDFTLSLTMILFCPLPNMAWAMHVPWNSVYIYIFFLDILYRQTNSTSNLFPGTSNWIFNASNFLHIFWYGNSSLMIHKLGSRMRLRSQKAKWRSNISLWDLCVWDWLNARVFSVFCRGNLELRKYSFQTADDTHNSILYHNHETGLFTSSLSLYGRK